MKNETHTTAARRKSRINRRESEQSNKNSTWNGREHSQIHHWIIPKFKRKFLRHNPLCRPSSEGKMVSLCENFHIDFFPYSLFFSRCNRKSQNFFLLRSQRRYLSFALSWQFMGLATTTLQSKVGGGTAQQKSIDLITLFFLFRKRHLLYAWRGEGR